MHSGYVPAALAVAIYFTGCREPKAALRMENAAAVAQYESALEGCRTRARDAGSYAVFAECEEETARHFCRESDDLRKYWAHCHEVGVEDE